MPRRASLRIGVVVPSGNEVHEHEFRRLCPAGVTFRFSGFSYPTAADGAFCDALLAQFAGPFQELRSWEASLILIGCTTASMLCANDDHHARLEALAGVPVVTAARASAAALAALGLTRLAVATPYGALSNQVVCGYLESLGVTVTQIRGLELDRTAEVWSAAAPRLTTNQILDLCLAVDSPAAEGLYLPCTGISSLEAVERFERRTGKLAISSVQAGFWASLRTLGYDGRQRGSGRLLESWVGYS